MVKAILVLKIVIDQGAVGACSLSDLPNGNGIEKSLVCEEIPASVKDALPRSGSWLPA